MPTTSLAAAWLAAVDRIEDPHEAALRRIALPLAKFWVCKRTPGMVAEARGPVETLILNDSIHCCHDRSHIVRPAMADFMARTL